MQTSILDVYETVKNDTANADQNGQLSYATFSRMSKRAELQLLDFLTGGVTNERLPIPWISQKNKDWLSHLITKFPDQVSGGIISRPADYYQYENFYKGGSANNSGCEEDEEDTPQTDECNTPIELLDGQQYYERCRTYIEELKPSMSKPIAKMVGEDLKYFASASFFSFI